MSFKTLFILVPVLAVGVLTGCSKSCEGLCDDALDEECYKDDSDSTLATFDHAGCYASCQRQEDMEDDDVDDCKNEFDDLKDCIGQQSDICKAFDIDTEDGKYKKCNSVWEDYSTCVTDYCKDHTKRDYCS